MKTLFDYATPTSLATNASCPQRPTWQISPVGYKWAQAVFGDCKQRHTRDIKKRVEALPKPVKIWRRFLFALNKPVPISCRQTGKLSWMSVF
jgi:hypothetical protein